MLVLKAPALAIAFQLSSPASSPETIDEVATNHLRIVHAIASRDPAKAMAAMSNVIEVGKSRIQGSIEGLERRAAADEPAEAVAADNR